MNKVVGFLAGCAIAAQILYPLVTGSSRDAVTIAVVVFLASAALAHASYTRGPRWAALLFVATAGLGLAAEMVGTATGLPFGSYFYATGRLGPDIVGVPAVVPLAWTAGFYPVWCAVTYVLAGTDCSPAQTRRRRVLFTAVGMVGWDLYLDTQMVTDGQWTWTSPFPGLPGLPSIPVTNYLGWFLVAALMAAIVEVVSGRIIASTTRPKQPGHSDTVPILLFLWTWLGSALAHAALLTGPELRFSALYGLFVMGIVGVPLVWTGVGRFRGSPTVRLP